MDVYHKEAGELLAVLEETRHVLTIVEGSKDRKALERLGFTNLIEVDGPLYRVVEVVADAAEKNGTVEPTVAILTDLDAAGKKLYRYFYHELTRRGIRVDNRARLALFRTDVRQIEGLTGFLDRLV